MAVRLRIRRSLLLGAAALDAAWLLWMTLRPNARVAAELGPVADAARGLRLSPAALVDGAGNVVVFVPLGFLLAAALGGGWTRRTTGAVAIAAAFSATIELVQRALPQRVASLADWALNVAGAVLGAAAAWHLGRGTRAGASRAAADAQSPSR